MSTTFMKFSDTFRTPQVNCPLCSLCPFPPPSNPVTTDLSVSYLTLVCLCVHMFVVLVWECVEARGWPWVCAHLMFWGQGLSLNLEITSWARLASQQVPGIPVSLSPWGWDYRCPSVPCFFFFLWMWGVIACVAGTSLIPCQPCHLYLTTMHWFVFLTTRVSYLLDFVSLGHSKSSLGRVCLAVSTSRKPFAQTPSLPYSLFLPFPS